MKLRNLVLESSNPASRYNHAEGYGGYKVRLWYVGANNGGENKKKEKKNLVKKAKEEASRKEKIGMVDEEATFSKGASNLISWPR